MNWECTYELNYNICANGGIKHSVIFNLPHSTRVQVETPDCWKDCQLGSKGASRAAGWWCGAQPCHKYKTTGVWVGFRSSRISWRTNANCSRIVGQQLIAQPYANPPLVRAIRQFASNPSLLFEGSLTNIACFGGCFDNTHAVQRMFPEIVEHFK